MIAAPFLAVVPLARMIADRCTDPCGGLDFMEFDFPAWLVLVPIGLIALVVAVVVALIHIGRSEQEHDRAGDRGQPPAETSLIDPGIRRDRPPE